MPHGPGEWGLVLFDFTWPPAWAVLWNLIVGRLAGRREPERRIYAYWCGTAIMLVFIALSGGFWLASSAAAGSAVLAVLWWWRRKRRRLLSLLTGKYRYIRDGLVRVMRERARPRLVLRPAPGAVP